MIALATSRIACDISEYQCLLDDSYPHRWIIIRSSESIWKTDNNFPANLARCRKAVADGRLDGFTVYHVWFPGNELAQALRLAALLGKITPGMALMLDVESWGGQIRGDHSAQIRYLWGLLVSLLGGDPESVWYYGNRGDLASICPTRPAGARVIVAAYGPTMPSDVPGFFGWQYTDGQDQWGRPSALPASSAPFGRCDHNVFPGQTSASMRASDLTDVPAQPTSITPTAGDDMYELVSVYSGATPVGVFRIGGLYVAHVDTKAQWIADQASPLCAGGKTNVIGVAEFRLAIARVNANKTAFAAGILPKVAA